MNRTRFIIWVVIIVLIVGGGFYYYLRKTGRLRTGAEAVIGCQNSRDISRFFGAPGTNLIAYNLFGHEISIHHLVAPYLDHIQKAVNEAKTGYNFTNVTSFNMRPKKGGGGRSLHSWGIAIDINPETNPYQSRNWGPPETDIPGPIIDIFKKYGFAWGGDWPGERDPMHFEWYGAGIAGETLDKISSQKILTVATDVDGVGSPNNNGSFSWIVPFGSHTITAKAHGYRDVSFSVSLACFSDTSMNILMEPLPSYVPGSISGKVSIAGNYPMLVPASIFLDGRLVGVSTLRGDYYIPNIHAGNHKVEGRIMFFPGNAATFTIVPGQNLKNINITIGR